MSSGKVIRVDDDFYDSYILKQKKQEKDRGNDNCSDKTATAILRVRLDRVGGLADDY